MRESDELERVLDVQLGQVLAPPKLPAHFRVKLQAALVRVGESALSEARARLERERQEKLIVLEENYVRLQRRTLGTMIGGAFAAGALTAVVLPWVTAHFGSFAAATVVASIGAAAGIWIGISSWLRPRGAASFGDGLR